MCMLTFLPSQIQPDTDALANGAHFNDDGHGFAIVAQNRLIVRRGMTGEHVIEQFARLRRTHPDGPALFHSRFGTHGTIGRANCHPFRVGGDCRTVLAHNGVLPKQVRPQKDDRRCDTRIAAEDFLPRQPFGSLDTQTGRDGMARWLGPHNKLVILTVDPRYQRHSYLLNEECGWWDHGSWYSNMDFRDPARLCLSLDWTAEADSYQTCAVCLSDSVDLDSGYCQLCGACADCGEPAEYCFCYAPARIGHKTVTRYTTRSEHAAS